MQNTKKIYTTLYENNFVYKIWLIRDKLLILGAVSCFIKMLHMNIYFRFLLLFFILALYSAQANAAKYFWIGNSGNWSDLSHWVTSSGGSTHHTLIPGPNDSIYFDANSFAIDGYAVSVDSNHIYCAYMDWSGVNKNVEFLSSTSDTLDIGGSLFLSPKLSMNFLGLIRFVALSGNVVDFNPCNKNLRCGLVFNSDTVNLLGRLNAGQSNLYIYDGVVNTNSFAVSCRNFNTSANLLSSIPVLTPVWIGQDSLTVFGSIAVANALDFQQDGDVYFQCTAKDSNYINLYTNKIPGNIWFTGNKKVFLLSDFETDGKIEFRGGCNFNSQNFNITSAAFVNATSLTKTIVLGTSDVNITGSGYAFQLISRGLNLSASNASLNFSYAGLDTVRIFSGNDSVFVFGEVHLPTSPCMLFSSFRTPLLSLNPGSRVMLAHGIKIRVNSFTGTGTCGNFIYLSSFCADCITCEDAAVDCPTSQGIIESYSGVPISVDYFKISDNKVQGAVFTANNSFNEGFVNGWTISEPNDADTLYWIGNSGEWNNSAHWSYTPGGPAAGCIPDKSTHVIFDVSSFSSSDTVEVEGNAYCGRMTWINFAQNGRVNGNGRIVAADSIILSPRTTLDMSHGLHLINNTTDTITIDANNAVILCDAEIKGSATWLLEDTLETSGSVSLVDGNLSINHFGLICNQLIAGGSLSRKLDYSHSLIKLMGIDTVWRSSGSNLTIIKDTGTVVIATTSVQPAIMDMDGEAFFNLFLEAPHVRLAGGTTAKLIKIMPSVSVEFEPLKTIIFDSLSVSGSCSAPVVLSAYYGSTDTVVFSKAGYDTLNISQVILRNVCADTSSGRHYVASASQAVGKYSGWTFSGAVVGQKYFWTGLVSTSWNNPANWEVNALPATCVPGPMDTVVFDQAHLDLSVFDTVLVQSTSFCAEMDWSGTTAGDPALLLSADLYTGGSVFLCDSMVVDYSSDYNNFDVEAPTLIIAPENHDADFDPICRALKVNITFDGLSTADTIHLLDSLGMDSTATLNVLGGTFDAHEFPLFMGVLTTTGDAAKAIDLNKSSLSVVFSLIMQSPATLALDMDSSFVKMYDNPSFYTLFDGGGQTYFDVHMLTRFSDSLTVDYQSLILGSNSFRILNIDPGMHLSLENGTTQTFDSLFHAFGTCVDSIFINSDSDGDVSTLLQNSADSIISQCVVVRDIVATNGAKAVFSRDAGNNTDWAFDNVNATNAFFGIPPALCYGDSILFTNLSSAYSGNMADLTFDWRFSDGDSSFLISPQHLFPNAQEYIVTLTSTYVPNQCKDIFSDTMTIYRPQVSLLTSETDTTICSGDLVSFSANSINPSPEYLYMAGGIPVIQSPDSFKYATDSLQHLDSVYVLLTYEGCVIQSKIFTFIVNPLPLATLTCDDLDTTICIYDTVTITAAFADKFDLSLNGNSIGGIDTVYQWTTDTISNGSMFTLFALDTITGCQAQSDDTLIFSVIPLPVVGLACSDPDTSICANDLVTFTASGASQYVFYRNGLALGLPSPVNVLAISDLAQGEIVSVEGISASGCRAFSADAFEMQVAPLPIVGLLSSDVDNVICNGDSLAFESSGAEQYQFYLDGVPVGAYSINNVYYSLGFTNGQTVTVSGRLGNCYNASDTVHIIDVRPSISWIYSQDSICAYDMIDFEADGDTIYEFFIDGSSVMGPSIDSIFHAAGLTDGQVVSVTGTSGACVPSPLVVTVLPVPVVDLSCSDADTLFCEGTSVTFTASGATSYQFYLDGIATGPMSATNVYTSSSLTDGQEITVQANSSFACLGISADTFVVEVQPIPVVSMSQTDADFITCFGDTVIFTASGATDYEFFVSGSSQGAPSAANVFVTAGLYSGDVVTVQGTTGICGAVSSDVFTYVVNPIPAVALSAMTPLSICNGDSLWLNANGATTYEFFVDGVSTGAPSPVSQFISTVITDGQTISVTGYSLGCMGISDTAYTIDVNYYPVLSFSTDGLTSSICYGDTVTFEGNGAQNYIFYIDGIPYSTDSVFATSDLLTGQQISLYAGNGVCWLYGDTIYSYNVDYLDLALSSSAPDGIVCDGINITFTAFGADLYEFFVDGISQGSPSATNTFVSSSLMDGQLVTVAGSSLGTGCTQNGIENVLVHIQDVPTINVSPSNTFCEGDSALLTSSILEGNQWYFDASAIVGAVDPDLWVFEEGAYIVEVSSPASGSVLSAGANNEGQLGDNSLTNSQLLTPAFGIDAAAEVACGSYFSLVLLNDGSVMAWGDNEFGALGNGTYSDSPQAVAVGSLSGILQIAAGNRHGLALNDDSTLVAWGDNTFGQLGYGNYSTSNFPFPVINLDSVISIAAGEDHSLAVTADGSVWAWGRNQFGQLGDSTLINQNAPVQVKFLSNIIEVRAGAYHSMALASDGSLYVWGANSSGQLGTGDFVGAITPVKVNLPIGLVGMDGGYAHSIAVDSLGNVYTWGDNAEGQLGQPTLTNAVYPVKLHECGSAQIAKAGRYNSFIIRSDKSVYSWGKNVYGELGQQSVAVVDHPQAAPSLFGVASLDAGFNHVAFISDADHACSSSPTVISVDTIPLIPVFFDGMTLYTTASGTDYQWYYNGSMIPGANAASVDITAEGTYSVLVTFANGCSGFSDDYVFGVGMGEFLSDQFVSVYPNPNNGSFIVSLNMSQAVISSIELLEVTDIYGRLLFNRELSGLDTQLSIELPGILPGVYTIGFINTNGNKVFKRFVVTK